MFCFSGLKTLNVENFAKLYIFDLVLTPQEVRATRSVAGTRYTVDAIFSLAAISSLLDFVNFCVEIYCSCPVDRLPFPDAMKTNNILCCSNRIVSIKRRIPLPSSYDRVLYTNQSINVVLRQFQKRRSQRGITNYSSYDRTFPSL